MTDPTTTADPNAGDAPPAAEPLATEPRAYGQLVPPVPGYNYAWVLCVAEIGRWPATWEYSQWIDAAWRGLAAELKLTRARHHLESPNGYEYDRILQHFEWDAEAAWAALCAWLEPKVARGRPPKDIQDRVADIIAERERHSLDYGEG